VCSNEKGVTFIYTNLFTYLGSTSLSRISISSLLFSSGVDFSSGVFNITLLFSCEVEFYSVVFYALQCGIQVENDFPKLQIFNRFDCITNSLSSKVYPLHYPKEGAGNQMKLCQIH
jgi:hypothetical protein